MFDGDAGMMFQGAVPDAYEDLMVPLFFQPFAEDLVARAVALEPVDVLEIAAGTGVVTRALVEALPGNATIVATDLNRDMLAVATAHEAESADDTGEVTWRVADAQQLPFDDESFDLVVCQFGVQYFSDRPASHAEVLRVLRPGGSYLFSTWDSIANNPIPCAVEDAYRRVLPDARPNLLTSVAHGYHDQERIRADVEEGGLVLEAIDTVDLVAVAESARAASQALAHGSVLASQLDGHPSSVREEIQTVAAGVLEDEYGTGALRAPMRAFVVTASRP
jgi:SAM-dependent methyltransferase